MNGYGNYTPYYYSDCKHIVPVSKNIFEMSHQRQHFHKEISGPKFSLKNKKKKENYNTYCNTGNSEVIIAGEVLSQCSKIIKCCTTQKLLKQPQRQSCQLKKRNYFKIKWG